MKTRIILIALTGCLGTSLFAAAPLTESTFTEIVKEVNVVDASTKSATPAKLSELFKAPNLVRTGRDSRTELTAPDETITRVGANSVFSFEPMGRTLQLEQGNVLFHSPKGKGGGTIKSHGISAAVLGTTLIVSATADGGIKVILLEGSGSITLDNGRKVTLRAGQMVYLQPGGKTFSAVLDINLQLLVENSNLVNGFAHPLPSLTQIQSAIGVQRKALASGKAVDTHLAADNFAKSSATGNGFQTVSVGTYQSAVPVPLQPAQFGVVAQSDAPGSTGGRGFASFGFR
jgi:hypothetical protein